MLLMQANHCDSGSFSHHSRRHSNKRVPRFRSLSTPVPVATIEHQLAAPKFVHHAPEKPTVAVVGVGYVGLHLATAFSKHYSVIAFDTSADRIAALKDEFAAFKSIKFTSDRHDLRHATHYLVAVPTPINDARQIQTQYLEEAISTVAKYARSGAVIVIESSVAVGMTRTLLSPVLSTRRLKGGMSPERVDPGRIDPPYEKIPKVISGLDDISPGSLESIRSLYAPVFNTLVEVSRPEVAEMMKLYENCQRLMCIAFANEMADACINHEIDAQEVAQAAASKPFGYLPMYPGIGVGGPCIPVNPFYLLSTDNFPLLEAASNATRERPTSVADKIMATIKGTSPTLGANTTKVLMVGVGFKRGQALTTHSPGLALLQRVHDFWKADCHFADPLVTANAVSFARRLDEGAEWCAAVLETFDLIIVAVKQDGLDLSILDSLRHPKIHRLC